MSIQDSWVVQDPKVRLKYGREITVQSVELNWWNKFINNNERAVIMSELTSEMPKPEGGTVRVYFRDRIEGDGVTGNQDFEQNRGKQTHLYQDVDYHLFGNSMISKVAKLESKMAVENFRNRTNDSLAQWAGTREDRIITARLSENCTNIVACSAADGVYANANNTTTIKAGDGFSVAAIKEAKRRAKNGVDGTGAKHPKIQPFKIKTVSKEGIVDYVSYYVLVIGQHAAIQLSEDPVWIEAQKFAQQRGDNNPIFTGALGTYDGVVVFERNNWDSVDAGILTSDVPDFVVTLDGETTEYATGFDSYTGAADQVTEINLFLGATAGLFPFDEGFDYHEDTQDSKRKLTIGIDRGLGFSKTKFVGKTVEEQKSLYHNKDFGVIAIVNAIS